MFVIGEAMAINLPEAGSEVGDLPGFYRQFADRGDARLHYVVGGAGSTVVLLHGYPYTREIWRELMPRLMQSGYRVIAPDLRGLGSSSKTAGGYDCLNGAEDVREIVRMCGADAVHLLGADIGAMVAYAYASRHADELSSFTFSESLIPGFGLEELMNPATGGYWHFGFHAQVDVATMLTAGKEADYLMPWYSMMSVDPGAADRAKSVYLPHYSAPGGMRAGFEHYATLVDDGKANRSQFSGKLRLPTLVLSGERGIPQFQTLACVERVAECVEHDLVPAAGHTYSTDNPEWTAARLIRFFQTAEGGHRS